MWYHFECDQSGCREDPSELSKALVCFNFTVSKKVFLGNAAGSQISVEASRGDRLWLGLVHLKHFETPFLNPEPVLLRYRRDPGLNHSCISGTR